MVPTTVLPGEHYRIEYVLSKVGQLLYSIHYYKDYDNTKVDFNLTKESQIG
jgi:hypothetical protein